MSESTHQTQSTQQTTHQQTAMPEQAPIEDVFTVLRQATNAALPIKPKGILQLQRLIGNQATRRVLLQRQGDDPAKLEVGKAYKTEATNSKTLLPKTIVAAFHQYKAIAKQAISDAETDEKRALIEQKLRLAEQHYAVFEPFAADPDWVSRLQEVGLTTLDWILQRLVRGLMKQDEAFVEAILAGTTKVDYLNEDQRKEYHAKGTGSTLIYDQRAEPEPVDTEGMFSLQSGPGFGIFVMDGSDLYVGEHKGAQFHHSSFLAGEAADSAGELSTDESGKLEVITNKSGHYLPTEDHLAAMLRKLKSVVDLSTTEVRSMNPPVTYDNVDEFMQQYDRKKAPKTESSDSNRYGD